MGGRGEWGTPEGIGRTWGSTGGEKGKSGGKDREAVLGEMGGGVEEDGEVWRPRGFGGEERL